MGYPMEVNMRLIRDNTSNEQPAVTDFPYYAAIRTFIYLKTSFMPDLAIVVDQLSIFVAYSNTKQSGTLKRALRYLSDTLRDSITYAR